MARPRQARPGYHGLPAEQERRLPMHNFGRGEDGQLRAGILAQFGQLGETWPRCSPSSKRDRPHPGPAGEGAGGPRRPPAEDGQVSRAPSEKLAPRERNELREKKVKMQNRRSPPDILRFAVLRFAFPYYARLSSLAAGGMTRSEAARRKASTQGAQVGKEKLDAFGRTVLSPALSQREKEYGVSAAGGAIAHEVCGVCRDWLGLRQTWVGRVF